MSEWISYALWPEDKYQSACGDSITIDRHDSEDAARAVCRTLEKKGFGGDGEFYPVRTWVAKADPIKQ